MRLPTPTPVPVSATPMRNALPTIPTRAQHAARTNVPALTTRVRRSRSPSEAAGSVVSTSATPTSPIIPSTAVSLRPKARWMSGASTIAAVRGNSSMTARRSSVVSSPAPPSLMAPRRGRVPPAVASDALVGPDPLP